MGRRRQWSGDDDQDRDPAGRNIYWDVDPEVAAHETGRWSRSRGGWVPTYRDDIDGPPDTEHSDFAIGRFDDTGEIRRPRWSRTEADRVIDHDGPEPEWTPPARRQPPRRPAYGDFDDYGDGGAPGDDSYGGGFDRGPYSRRGGGDRPGGTGRTAARRPESVPQRAPERRGRPADWRPTRDSLYDDDPYDDPYDDSRDSLYAAEGYDDGLAGPIDLDADREWEREPERPRRRPVPRDADERDDRQGGFVAAFAWALTFFTVPVVGFVAWALLFAADPQPGCDEAAGVVCAAPQEEALALLTDNLPQVGLAAALSLIIAMVLRWTTHGWKSFTIGFAAAVVGAGIATVFFTALNSA